MTTAAARALPAQIRGRAAGENFTVASLLVGARVRRRLLAIYDVARFVDELGDAATGDRLELLDWAEQELDRAYAGTAMHPIFNALGWVLRECPLPREPFVRLIDANRLDQRRPETSTWTELRDYCALSANPVGELVLHAFGVATAERVRLSDSVCTGLQLVEHWQDVGEDARNGRVYLPAEDRERFGVTVADLSAERTSDALQRLLEFETERAASLIEAGRPLCSLLAGRARLAVAGYVAGGLAQIAQLRRARFRVLESPVQATRALRLRYTLTTIFAAR